MKEFDSFIQNGIHKFQTDAERIFKHKAFFESTVRIMNQVF